MSAALLVVLGFIAVIALIVLLAWRSSLKFREELRDMCLSRGWDLKEIHVLAGSWHISGLSAGISWKMVNEPNESDSDRDWHTVFTAELPFPETARMEVMMRMAWNSLNSGLLKRIYEGSLKALAPAGLAREIYLETVSLKEVPGVGDPLFQEWFAVLGDARTACHLITPEAARLMLQPEKMRRPTISIKGSQLTIKANTSPVKIDEVRVILEVGQILLRQAASGQRLSA